MVLRETPDSLVGERVNKYGDPLGKADTLDVVLCKPSDVTANLEFNRMYGELEAVQPTEKR
jgi:hypothetical protein